MLSGKLQTSPRATNRLCPLTLVLACILCLGTRAAMAVPKAAPKPTNEDCLACHGDSTLSHEVNGKPVSLFVNPDKFKESMHGSMFQCVDCHTDLKSSPH